jgi:hypothetical protein
MTVKYQIVTNDGTLAGWNADLTTAVRNARWLADRFHRDYQVIRLDDKAPVARCNAEEA